MRVLVLSVVVSSVFVSSYGQTCGIKWTGSSYLVPDDLENDFLLAEEESFNVAFVTVSAHPFNDDYGVIKTQLTTNSSGQWVAFYVPSVTMEMNDLLRKYFMVFYPILRCVDGTSVSLQSQSVLIAFNDANNRPPVFSANSYTFHVSLPWPSHIPITQGNNIFVQDLDYNRENARVNVAFSQPDILRVEVYSLLPDDRSYDFKVDLYNLDLSPGNYAFSLEATDGVHNSVVPINLIVTEPTCRAHLRDPVFGKKDIEAQAVNVYQTTLNEHSMVGDVLTLQKDVITIEAYDPDEFSIVDLTLNVDYLAINNEGQLVVSRELSEKEVDALRPFTLAEITATERGSGRQQRVPLIIAVSSKIF